MIEYRQNKRLHYIGGPQAQQHIPAAASADWWDIADETCVAAYQPKGAASLAASYVNLANPGTYDAAPGVAPTWASGTGWTFNGSTQYLDSNVLATGSLTLAVRLTWTSGDGVVIGARSTAAPVGFLAIHPAWGTLTPAWYYATAYAGTAVDNNDGVYVITQYAGYKDGVSNKTFGGPPASMTKTIYIGAYNYFPLAYFTGNVQAVAIYSTTLDATQVATLSSAMAAL